jgi:transaldolase
MPTPIQELYEAGTAPWLDNIRRGWLKDGTFARMVDEGVVGVTTNPTIFQKAFADTEDYTEGLRALADDGVSAVDAFFALAIEDVQAAADALADVHRATGGLDGRVSFELHPGMAHDTEASTQSAAELFARIDRPNVFIKIPGTAAGPQAIEDSIAAGINVNVTLLFAIESYTAIHEAYIRGLERRVERGEPIGDIYSVASFFVSRVDTAVDKQLPEGSPLRGRAAVANAKLAYQRFLEMTATDRWRRLAEAGANVQRPLWASTGVKNPAYRDVLYVEELIGPQTVNTMPDGTIRAFQDHGTVRRTVDEDVEEARRVLDEVEAAGVSMDEVTKTLQTDGVDAFVESFESLLQTVDEELHAVETRGAA